MGKRAQKVGSDRGPGVEETLPVVAARVFPLSSQEAVRFISPPSLRYTAMAPPVSFVGREKALQALAANFERVEPSVRVEQEVRGVLLTSASGHLGIGLTALARRLAHTLAAEFPDGRLEIDLGGGMPEFIEPLDSVEAQRLLLSAFLEGPSLPEDEEALDQLYRDTFASHRVLLLLDNAAGPIQLRRLIPRQPSAVIVTARESFPELAKLYPYALEDLPFDEARALVVGVAPQCAKLSQRMMSRLLEHFKTPLALRIVAALLREPVNWTIRELFTSYKAALKRLKALRITGSNLEVTIALELAYEALPVDARPYFDALSVFPAPFTKAAAAAIWKVDVNTADAMLVALVRRNLVMYHPDQDTYALHNLVLLYAQELLLGQSERARVVVARFAYYFLAEVELVMSQMRMVQISTEESRTRIVMLWPHLWAAWRRMSGTDPGWVRPRSADQWMVEFLTRLLPVLNMMRPVRENIAILESGLEAAHRLDGAAEALILSSLGQVCAAQGDAARALAYHEQHWQIAVALHDRKSEAEALMHIGTSCGSLGDVKRAQESWRHALALFRMLEDPRATQIRAWLHTLDERLGAN